MAKAKLLLNIDTMKPTYNYWAPLTTQVLDVDWACSCLWKKNMYNKQKKVRFGAEIDNQKHGNRFEEKWKWKFKNRQAHKQEND